MGLSLDVKKALQLHALLSVHKVNNRAKKVTWVATDSDVALGFAQLFWKASHKGCT